jgi:signal transduction histidine kinase
MLDLQAVDLTTVVHSAVDVALSPAEAKGLVLDVVAPESLGPAYGDAGRLQQVVANLLDNAIKFTPKGGKISVSLKATDGQVRKSQQTDQTKRGMVITKVAAN